MESGISTNNIVEFPLYDRGKLSSEFIAFMRQKVDEEWMPLYDPSSNYRLDWNIIGLPFKIIFGYNDPKKPENIPFELWQENIPKVRAWLRWVSTELFDPEKMVDRSWLTDRVLMRIATSQIDKLTLPKDYLDEMFDNMTQCYYIRKGVYEEYKYRIVLKLPFW